MSDTRSAPTSESTIEPKHRVVSREEWLAARRELLAKEKELTRQRDALARERRALPWVRVDRNYVFDGPNGKESLADLFAHRDLTMAVVSIAPIEQIEPFRRLMGWSFKWVSSSPNSFNRDFGVSFEEGLPHPMAWVRHHDADGD